MKYLVERNGNANSFGHWLEVQLFSPAETTSMNQQVVAVQQLIALSILYGNKKNF
jgi:hypothetical protein